MPTATAEIKREILEHSGSPRINAGARMHGLSYSQFMGALKKNNVDLNRKVLADLAMNEPEAFKAIVEKVK